MEIFFKPSFIKDFKKLPKEIKSKIKRICVEVFPSAKNLKDIKTPQRYLQIFPLK
jgi:mRNA-degrading endonuclease RelE of RelBE toxin-antitoxin system